MDASGTLLVATALGAGVATGLLTMLGVTFMALPASWVMNRFVYHNWLMRGVMGATAGVLSIFAFGVIVSGCILGFLSKPYYFGLFPLYTSTGASTPSGWLGAIVRLWNTMVHPLLLNMDNYEQDYAALKETMKAFVVPDDAPHMEESAAGAAAQQLAALLETVPQDTPIHRRAVYEPFFEAARKAGSQRMPQTWAKTMELIQNTGIGEYQLASAD